MKLSQLSIQELVKYINDDEKKFRYRSGPDIVELFNRIGSQDDYWLMNKQGLFGSRAEYTKSKLNEYNSTNLIKTIFEQIVDSRIYQNNDELAQNLNKVLKHDGYQLEKTSDHIYKITGKDIDDPIQLTAHFEDIERQTINSIRLAKFSIWVCVAWITHKEIANELYKQHKNGINIRVIVNNDELTNSKGCDFTKTGIEYYKISPQNLSYKNLMHHKFCIIDLKKVLTGSFNWTLRANYNYENIEEIESREKAEEYAERFIKIIQLSK